MPEIKGIIQDILFQNEDNGYVVARIKEGSEIITIVGCVPDIREGQNLLVKGEWIVHPKFGRQLKVNYSEIITPSSLVGIERYLGSGVISGIGPVTAKKIVEKFGEESLDILDYHIERLREIEGIGEKKINLIYDSYSKQREVRNIMVFLQTYNISSSQCVKIYKKFGAESINTVKENPYLLCEEIAGIGFKTADKIARSLGIDSESTYRIQSGINYIVSEFCILGNTYMPMKKLIVEAEKTLVVPDSLIEENIYKSAAEQKIKVEVIQGENCVFTLPYYFHEIGVTKKLILLATTEFTNIDVLLDKEIQDFEAAKGINFAQIQREAIKGAVESGIEIITGGPGTGKTTIINCIIDLFEKAGLKVLMAAPTGRAAKRMTEATGKEAKTIHRLLEMGFNSEDEGGFSKGEDSPLECDVVIIDEASMIDIMLMNSLLSAIEIGTRLIIVGDVDQLPSVGPGNVLSDLIESNCIKVVKLKDIFRQTKESLIVLNAHKINSGEMPILNEGDKDFFFLKCDGSTNILKTLLELIDKRLPNFNDKWNREKDIQVLSPMRKGELGVNNLNSKLQGLLNPSSKNKKEKDFRDIIFREGDKVMQTKNNYSLKWTSGSEDGQGVFNGDMGYIEEINEEDDTLTVIYDDDRKISYDNVCLDELELAYAITIHKSQGSEFPVVIIPVFMGPPLLMNRNLLYTAITRAKQMVVLIGSSKAINFMINNNKSFERYSALKWRITEIMGDETVDNGDRC